MKSPITGKIMELVKKPTKFNFRKEDFEIVYHYYLCKDSKEQFTSNDLDLINENQIHNKYREMYGIPFPEEIKQIRDGYGVSASKMSEILGFGTNSYRLYEAGEIPSVANGRLILAVKHPKEFMRQVQASAHLLSKKELNVLEQTTSDLMETYKKAGWNNFYTKLIFQFDTPNEFTGYRKPDFDKIANVISYFGEQMDLYKTKLNKLLFYADFGYYMHSGFSITGNTYRAIQMGPVPSGYEKLYAKLCDDGMISINEVLFGDGNYAEQFKGKIDFDEDLFNEEEKKVLSQTVKRFKELNTKKIVDLSHEETAWIKNEKVHNLISYEYAFDLKNFN